jgi:hypothetical protein
VISATETQARGFLMQMPIQFFSCILIESLHLAIRGNSMERKTISMKAHIKKHIVSARLKVDGLNKAILISMNRKRTVIRPDVHGITVCLRLSLNDSKNCDTILPSRLRVILRVT